MTQAAPVQAVATPAKPAAGVQRLLQRKCACGASASALTSECTDCGRKRVLGLQTKLAVSDPGDGWEREADRIAEQVMRNRNPPSGDDAGRCDGTPVAGGGDAVVLDGATSGARPLPPAAAPGSEAGPLRRQASVELFGSGRGPGAVLAPLLAQGGAPLEGEARAFMERRFGYDFGNVRVHTGPLATHAARAVNALAFTSGRDIVFRDGEYRPRTQDGRRLIAHELAHVVQQSASPGTAHPILRAACPDECLECPPDGVVPEGCECLGDEKPRLVVTAPVPVRIVRLDGASSEGVIKRDIRKADKTWRSAGIELDAQILSIDRTDTEKILGTDERGRVRGNVQIEPEEDALNRDSTRALLGLQTESGNEKLTVPAGQTPHNVVVYYVPEFNRCDKETAAIGCAFSNSHAGRYFVLIEKHHQDVALAHELGHIWGNPHVEDKRNVMYERASRTGLAADQIRKARRRLSLGSLRCLAKGQSDTDREQIEEEQQIGQLLLQLIEGDWSGPVTVNGTPRDSTIEFEVLSDNKVHGTYWHDKLDGDRAGGVLDGVITAGRLDYDWKQTTGEETTGKGSFALSSIYPPFRLSGRWGVGESRTNGGDWTVTLEQAPAAEERG